MRRTRTAIAAIALLAGSAVGCAVTGPDALVPGAPHASYAAMAPVASSPGPSSPGLSSPVLAPARYRRVEDGRFELTAPLRFETERFGTVVLTPGYRSDGSSSPIRDVEGSRAAGFLHDALYAASGHLRFPNGAPASYTKAEADEAYCAEMERRGVPAWHGRANCEGVRRLPHIRVAWQRLAPKRERRWAQWAARPPLR